jgi:hypothetical protein
LHKYYAVRQAAAGIIAIRATIGMLLALLQMQLPTLRDFAAGIADGRSAGRLGMFWNAVVVWPLMTSI